MNRTILAAIVVFLTGSLFAEEGQRYLVATRRPFRAGALREIVRDVRDGVTPRNVIGFETFDGFAAELTSDEVAKLRRSREVRWIEPVVERHAVSINNEQSVPYGIDVVNARQAWGGRRTGAVNVAVLDTGIDYTHPELMDFVAGDYNAIQPTARGKDDGRHGTHVAGTIAAADNGVGVVGVAPHAETRLWAVKVLSGSGSGNSAWIIRGIDWVVAKKKEVGGNWIVNMSLGSARESAAERESITRALDTGILIVAAAGNESSINTKAPLIYPAAYPGVIAVGAVDEVENVAYFSNQGPELDLTAPGVRILSTVPLGTNFTSNVIAAEESFVGDPLTGSGVGTVTGEFVYCGLGDEDEFPPLVRGKIAVIKRGGGISFAIKARNAVNAGAVAVVIFNNGDLGNSWTLRPASEPWSKDFVFPVVTGLTTSDGNALLEKRGVITVSNEPMDYDLSSGTSMATPHVTGSAALLWAMAPNATASEIAEALMATAIDRGKDGPDSAYGAGVVDVEAAARRLAPFAFIGPPSTGRPIGKRGRG